LLSLLLLSPTHADELWTMAPARDRKAAQKGPLQLDAFVKLARALEPAVVNVVALGIEEAPAPQSGQEHGPRRNRGLGTGFVIQKSGYILTNAHVIEKATDIRVRLADERELSARLIGRDDRTDMALLKIEADGDLPVAPFGNSDEVQIGEWVIAIGNPFGLDHTVTTGIVSAKGRRDIRPSNSQGYYDFIQTDASINPGNSGGPLINTRGEVIGMNTAMNAQAQGIGFAIPINMAKVIVPLLRKHGHAPRSWVGLYPQALSANLRKALGLEPLGKAGSLISEVVPESPAEAAGLKSGDVVVEFGGKPIARWDDLTWLVSTAPAGKKVTLSVMRDRKPIKLELVPQQAPDEEAPPTTPKPPAKKSPLGMTVAEITEGIAQELGTPQLRGVVVMSLEPDSPAVEAGLERGDIILRIGSTEIHKLEEYAKRVREAAAGQLFQMLIRREGRSLWVAFPKR
jgi:serine protease Do